MPLPGSKTKTPVPVPNTKKTPIPLPGSSSKSSKTKAAPAQLSQEFVGDSDDSSDEASKKKVLPKKQGATTIAVHRPKSNGVAKTGPEAKKLEKDTQKKSGKEAIAPKKSVPKQVTQQEDGAESSSSEESSGDAETDIKQAQQREAQKNKNQDSDSSSEDSSDDSEEEAAPLAQRPEGRQSQTQTQTVTFQQARPYAPPEDFKAVATERAASSSNTSIFQNLKGKQIWHITAPEGVSLESLSRLAMDKAQNGEPIMEHKGISYGLVQAEDEAGGREVMIPAVKGYKAGADRSNGSYDDF